eukprot:6296747-Prymnesium_polylepis.1
MMMLSGGTYSLSPNGQTGEPPALKRSNGGAPRASNVKRSNAFRGTRGEASGDREGPDDVL